MSYSFDIIKSNTKTTLYLLLSVIIACAVALPSTVQADPCMSGVYGGVYEGEDCPVYNYAPSAPTLSYSLSYPWCKVAPCPTQVHLSWSGPVYGETVTSYTITRNNTRGPLEPPKVYTVNAPTTFYDDFVYGGSISYAVQAVNSYGYSTNSNKIYLNLP